MDNALQQFKAEINRLAHQGIPFFLLIDFEMKKPMIFPIADLPGDIMFSMPGYRKNQSKSPALVTGGQEFEFHADPIPYDQYLSAYEAVIQNALAGKTYLCNLTFPARIRTSLSLPEIFHISQARYKLCYKAEFVVFSPETFVQITDGRIFSYPMKGTIDARLPDAARLIMEDEKESAEHVTIVDLIRNDLSIYASEVTVDRFRYIDHLKTNRNELLQVSSVISGKLPPDYPAILGDILLSMLPAGSVSGAPKEETLRIIRQSENGPRGYYTGIMGYFDGKNFDSAVLIRYIEKPAEGMVYRSGGGITFMSDPEKEYRELVDKIYIPVY